MSVKALRSARYHPAAVPALLKNGGPPAKRTATVEELALQVSNSIVR